MVGRREGEKKARGRNRITGNLSVRSRPLAPPQYHPGSRLPAISRRGAASRRVEIDYTKAGAASTRCGRRGPRSSARGHPVQIG
jgi:hypothetical protein